MSSLTGVCVHLTKDYGLVLCDKNLLNDKLFMVFGWWTHLNGLSIGEIGDVDCIFEIGMELQFQIPTFTEKPLNSSAIVRIHSIQSAELITVPRLMPLLTIGTSVKETDSVATAMSVEAEPVLVHPQLAHYTGLNVPLTNADVLEVPDNIMTANLSEFRKIVTISRTFEALVIPMWGSNIAAQFKYVAVSVQNLGTNIYGCAKIGSSNERSVLLVDTENSSMEILCPRVILPANLKDKSNLSDYVFYYSACKDFPGRKIKYRAFRVNCFPDGVTAPNAHHGDVAEDAPQFAEGIPEARETEEPQPGPSGLSSQQVAEPPMEPTFKEEELKAPSPQLINFDATVESTIISLDDPLVVFNDAREPVVNGEHLADLADLFHPPANLEVKNETTLEETLEIPPAEESDQGAPFALLNSVEEILGSDDDEEPPTPNELNSALKDDVIKSFFADIL